MPNKTQRGNYYKRKTKELYEKMGYMVQLTEFTRTILIPGKRPIFTKIDVLGADGISIHKEKGIIFWNSKHATDERSRDVQLRQAKNEFLKYPFPSCVRLELVMWEPKEWGERIMKPHFVDMIG